VKVKTAIDSPFFGAFPTDRILKATKDVNVKGKGKAILLKTWTGPGGSGRLRLPDFKTIST